MQNQTKVQWVIFWRTKTLEKAFSPSHKRCFWFGQRREYYSEYSEDSEYESSPILSLNVITSKPPKEFLPNLIGQILDIDAKREYLEKLKGIILEEEDRTPKFELGTSSSSSISQIFEKYPITNPYQQLITKQL